MPLRVLMFGWELPPFNSGGLGVACNGLTKSLSKKNVDITFVLPAKVPVKVDHMRLIFADIGDVQTLGSIYASHALASLLNDPQMAGQLAWDYLSASRKYAQRAAQIAGKIDHDLIHAHDWLCFGAGLSAQTTSHKPLITHVHATEFDRSGGHGVNPVVYKIEREGLNNSDAIIAVSRFTKNLLTSHYGSDPNKVNVVHNGINPEEYHQVSSENILKPLKDAGYKIVLYVGRLTLQKGPDYLLKAAKQVLSYDPKVVFVIVGSGDMENQIIQETARLGISQNVLFAGFLRGAVLNQVFKNADLFVMPSVSEPYGITALESVINGTPAIISKQSGVSESLTHALKVDFWDTDEMTNLIISSLHYNSLHTSLRDNGQREVKNVSWDNAASKTIEVYNRVLQF